MNTAQKIVIAAITLTLLLSVGVWTIAANVYVDVVSEQANDKAITTCLDAGMTYHNGEQLPTVPYENITDRLTQRAYIAGCLEGWHVASIMMQFVEPIPQIEFSR